MVGSVSTLNRLNSPSTPSRTPRTPKRGDAQKILCYAHRVDLDAAKAIFARYTNRFIAAYVFGSVAAGRADCASDLDVIVIRNTTAPMFDRMREIMDLRLQLGHADMLIYTPREVEQMLAEPGRDFVKQALRTGYRIEGSQHRGSPLAQTG